MLRRRVGMVVRPGSSGRSGVTTELRPVVAVTVSPAGLNMPL
jgi:hypothetical protein